MGLWGAPMRMKMAGVNSVPNPGYGPDPDLDADTDIL